MAKRAKAQQAASPPSSAAADKSQAQQSSSGQPQFQDAIAMLSNDHRNVERLFEQFKSAGGSSEKLQLVKQVCTDFSIHSLLEEELFYPACRDKGVESKELDQAQVEHDGAKMLCADLRSSHPEDSFFDAKVQVLCEYITHHVGEEEDSQEGIFAKARSAGVDLNALGLQLQQRKQELMAGAQGRDVFIAPIRSLGVSVNQHQSEEQMSRQSNERERDEQGRFMESDDRYSSRRGGEDEGRRSGGGRGWYGDSEGHSRASERGWGERGSGRGSRGGRYEEDEDERYGSRAGGSRGGSYSRSERYEDEDGRSGGRGQGGWFGDSEGHSRASERGWEERGGQRGGGSQGSYVRRSGRYEDEDNGRSGQGRGWFGDSEAHSRAAERGWEHGHDSQRDSSRSEGGRSGGRGSQGHGGWFGDSEGHAEAARRRWEDR